MRIIAFWFQPAGIHSLSELDRNLDNIEFDDDDELPYASFMYGHEGMIKLISGL